MGRYMASKSYILFMYISSEVANLNFKFWILNLILSHMTLLMLGGLIQYYSIEVVFIM